MLSIITGVDASMITAITGYAGTLFTDLSLLVEVAIGLPLAFWVIRKVITLVRAR